MFKVHVTELPSLHPRFKFVVVITIPPDSAVAWSFDIEHFDIYTVNLSDESQQRSIQKYFRQIFHRKQGPHAIIQATH